MEELISIVIPVYNVEHYLSECLSSVKEQTHTNLDIIIVNDGSTDNSLEICQEFKKQDSRVIIVSQKNAGLSAARNAGIEIAKGRYITFLDSDDFISSDYIAYLYTMLTETDSDIAVCQREEVDENSQKIDQKTRKSAPMKVISGGENLMKTFLSENDIDTVAWGKLYATTLFSDVRYPVGKFHEDVYTTYQLIAKSKKLVVGFERNYFYRNRQQSISRSLFSLKHLDAIEAAKERAEFISKNYPRLLSIANASIIYATNMCVLRIAESSQLVISNVDDMLHDFQCNYRMYEKDFLRSNSSLQAKAFSLIACCNVKLAIKLWNMIKKE